MRYKGFKNSNRNENNDENISNNNFSSIYNVTSNNKSRIKNNINNLIENKSTKVKTNNDIALDEEKSSNISEDLSNDSFTLSDDSTSMKMEKKNYFLESNNNPKFKFEINEKINYSFIEYENDDNKDVIYNIDDIVERSNHIVKSDFCLNNSGDCLNISNCSLIKGEKENSEIDFSKNYNSPIPLFTQNHLTVSSPVKDERENSFNIKSKDKGIKKCDNINDYNEKNNNNLLDSIPKIENEKNNINNILGMNNDFSQGDGNFSFISNNNKNINIISSPYDSPILNSMNGKKI